MMKFVSSREIRVNPRPVFDSLDEEEEVVVTSHGKPVALMVGVSGGDLEETLRFLRRARAQAAVSRMRGAGDRIGYEEIEAEIKAARDERPGR